MPGNNNLKDFDDPRKILTAIYHQYGDSIIEDQRRFLAIFQDISKGQFVRELHLIKLSFSENIPSELYKKKNQIPFLILVPQLVKRLQKNHGIERGLAEWVVESWALTVEISVNGELPKIMKENKVPKISPEKNIPVYPTIAKYPCPKCGTPFSGVLSVCRKCGTSPINISDNQLNPKSSGQNVGLTTFPIAMFRANLPHTGEYGITGSAPTNLVIWQFKTVGGVSSSPAISNGIVYIGSDDNYLYAIEADTGQHKWRFKMGEDNGRYKTIWIIYSSPAISDGIVYIGSYDYNLYAIDAVTGTELWKFKTGEGVSSSPAVWDGVLYFGSWDKYLYAIDAETGFEHWRFETGARVRSSPAVWNGVVYVGSYDYNLYAIDAGTGELLWKFQTGAWVDSSPAVWNGIIYVGSGDNNLYAIDAVDGTELWRFKIGEGVISMPSLRCLLSTEKTNRLKKVGGVISSPSVSNGFVYVGGGDKNLYAIDAVTGTELWRFKMGDRVISSPAISNGVVYVGSGDKNLYAIDAVTGTELWRFKTGDIVISSPSVSNGIVYVGSDDDNLYAIGKNVISKSKLITPPSPPVSRYNSLYNPEPGFF